MLTHVHEFRLAFFTTSEILCFCPLKHGRMKFFNVSDLTQLIQLNKTFVELNRKVTKERYEFMQIVFDVKTQVVFNV